MYEVLVNRLVGLSVPRKSVVRLNDRPDMNLDIYRGRKKQYNINRLLIRMEQYKRQGPSVTLGNLFFSTQI